MVDRQQQVDGTEVRVTHDKMADADQYCGGRTAAAWTTRASTRPDHSRTTPDTGAESKRTAAAGSFTRTQRQQRANINMETAYRTRSRHRPAR